MNRYIDVYRASDKGLRDTNEDVEKVIVNMRIGDDTYQLDKCSADVFILCDGHGNSLVAEFVAHELEKNLTHIRTRYPLSSEYVKKLYSSIQNKIKLHPKRIADYAGCTALVMVRYIYQSAIWIQVMNLGDCRAVMSKSGMAIPLTRDHKPYWPDEKRRIDRINETRPISKQAHVHFDSGDWRIRDLSVSKSFGDLDNQPYISHCPDVFNYPLSNHDKFIVLACDGVWDVLENHEVINFISDHLTNNHIELYDIPNRYSHDQLPSKMSIAHKLAKYAIARGSTDNVSVIIIDLYASLSKKNEEQFMHNNDNIDNYI